MHTIHSVPEPPVLDGILDEPAWRDAAAITNFTQVLPVEGDAPTERTDIRFLYTRDALYVAVRCYDSDSGRILAKQMQHDGSLRSDDFVTLAFDTFFRQREGYYFSVNPVGVRVEGLIEDVDGRNELWDTIWDVRARVDETGWTAEAVIPFNSLSFDPRSDTWGFNAERVIRRKQETVRWTGISISRSVTQLSDFGELRGLNGMSQGIGLDLKPYASARYVDDDRTGKSDWDLKPGGDIIYRIRPSLTAQATFNTDFAEVEVDNRRVNLTRFPLFFPEKRDFFLQDSALFSFGGIGRTPLPYHSRRIGLGSEREPVDLIAGGRLTGRIGRTRIALLDVQQDAQDGVSEKNLAVVRVAQQVLKESSVGLILTNGDPVSDRDNTLIGGDFTYLNSRLPDGRQVVGNAYVMGTFSDAIIRNDDEGGNDGVDDLGGDDVAFGGDLMYPNEPFDFALFFREVGKKFDPALGFVDRTGIRDYFGFAGYTWRPNTRWIRSFNVGTRPGFITDLDDNIVAEEYSLPNFRFETPAGDEFWLEYEWERDVVDESFEIWPEILVPEGDYRYGQINSSFETSEARPLSVEVDVGHGDFYDGTTTRYGGELKWRPNRHLSTEFEYELREVDLPQGRFDVRISSASLNIAFTPNLFWNTIAQYDNQSNEVGLNSRVRWTIRPGNDVFFVVNQGNDYDDWDFKRLRSEVTMKVAVTFRY